VSYIVNKEQEWQNSVLQSRRSQHEMPCLLMTFPYSIRPDLQLGFSLDEVKTTTRYRPCSKQD
jgi:hypothetical protein